MKTKKNNQLLWVLVFFSALIFCMIYFYPYGLLKEQEERAVSNCSKFEVIAHVTGSTLELSLDTDLPPYTVVMFFVGRDNWSHFEPDGDNKLTMTIPYAYEGVMIEELQPSKLIDIFNDKWEETLHEKQQGMTDFNPKQFTFDDAYSSRYIDIWAAVPYQQSKKFSDECATLINRLPANIQYFFRDEARVESP